MLWPTSLTGNVPKGVYSFTLGIEDRREFVMTESDREPEDLMRVWWYSCHMFITGGVECSIELRSLWNSRPYDTAMEEFKGLWTLEMLEDKLFYICPELFFFWRISSLMKNVKVPVKKWLGIRLEFHLDLFCVRMAWNEWFSTKFTCVCMWRERYAESASVID